jgi:hypothetical protein
VDRYILEELKDKYWNIYKSHIDGYGEFIWRELSRREWNKAMRFYQDPYEREEYVIRTCVIQPDMELFDIDNSRAGLVTSLAVTILRESGFSSEPTGKIEYLMSTYDNEMQSFQHQVSCIITEAFPTLDIEEVEDWPLEKTIWYYSRAKYKIESLRGIELVRTEAEDKAIPTPGIQSNGDSKDFPELREQDLFMKGKLF